MNRKVVVAVALSILAQFAYADRVNDCLENCVIAYNKCVEDRSPLETCQLAQKNCETECRKTQ